MLPSQSEVAAEHGETAGTGNHGMWRRVAGAFGDEEVDGVELVRASPLRLDGEERGEAVALLAAAALLLAGAAVRLAERLALGFALAFGGRVGDGHRDAGETRADPRRSPQKRAPAGGGRPRQGTGKGIKAGRVHPGLPIVATSHLHRRVVSLAGSARIRIRKTLECVPCARRPLALLPLRGGARLLDGAWTTRRPRPQTEDCLPSTESHGHETVPATGDPATPSSSGGGPASAAR